jgi:XRCC1 N terminal domain
MRKSIVSLSKTSSSPSSDSTLDQGLDIAQIASVEISSEDAQHPFENALQGGKEGGWKAADPGPQVIRLNFDHPQSIRRIRLEFREQTRERSQEFALFASSAAFQKRQLVRQQWTFSPGNSAIEVEDYSVDLAGVLSLELEIDPGRHDKQAIATLESMAIA